MASMLFATSCSQDELLNEPSTGDYVNAKFTVSTPEGIGTRAAVNVGEGTTVNYVACAVYDSKGTEMPGLRQYVEIKEKKAEYSIRLVKGQEYRVAFFAYYDGENKGDGTNRYYDLTDMTNIVIKDAVSNREGRDAFTNYAPVSAQESMKAIEKNVNLYRPFAQLNLGAVAEDVEAAEKAGVVVTQSKITVSNVFTAFDAYNNQVAATAQPTEVVFDLYDIPGQDLYVDMDNDATTADEAFEYLALNYLLVGDAGSEKELTDVTFEWKTADGKTNSPATVFKNIPVQRNYRTNIIGYLLTNPAKFNITIDEQFEKPDYIVDAPWDGTTVTEPKKDADGTYIVKTAAELVWLANQPKWDANNDPKLGSIKLESDIDLNGKEMDAITFKGTFDGQGHTISNIVLVSYDGEAGAGASLFGALTMGTIKNLTIKNATADVNVNKYGNGYAGAVLAGIDDQGEITLENVHVYNSNIKGVNGVGGLVGSQNAGNVKLTLNNCSVNNTKVWNYGVKDESGHVAGLVGRVTGTLTIGENVATNNVEVIGIWTAKRQENSISATASTNLKDNLGSIEGTATVTGGSVTKYELTEGKNYVGSAAEFKSLNGKKGEIILTGDVDFNGKECNWINLSGTTTFDGKGYTLRNVNVTTDDDYSCGLFKYTSTGEITIKNLNIDNLKINNVTDTEDGNGYAGVLFGSTDHMDKITIENVHITNSDVCGISNVGGFVGYTTKPVSITNSSIKSTKIHNIAVENESGMVAGIVGTVNNTTFTVDETVVMEDITIEAYYAARRAQSYPENYSIGEYYGRLVGDNAKFEGNPTKTNVTTKKTEIK